ncbi:hypothetical protein D3C75_896810 [compost metagenome]
MVFVAAIEFDLLNHFLHALDVITVGNQHGVFSLHNNQIFHANRGDQAGFGINVTVLGIVAYHIAVMHIALLVFGADFPKRRP